MPEVNRELRLKLLERMASYQAISALRILILNAPELEDIDRAMIGCIDDDPPDEPSDEFVGKLMDCMRYPLDAGKLTIPAIMWTDDERDTPKMIEETLCVLEVALGEYITARHRVQSEEQHKVTVKNLTPHIERVARLIAATQK